MPCLLYEKSVDSLLRVNDGLILSCMFSCHAVGFTYLTYFIEVFFADHKCIDSEYGGCSCSSPWSSYSPLYCIMKSLGIINCVSVMN